MLVSSHHLQHCPYRRMPSKLQTTDLQILAHNLLISWELFVLIQYPLATGYVITTNRSFNFWKTHHFFKLYVDFFFFPLHIKWPSSRVSQYDYLVGKTIWQQQKEDTWKSKIEQISFISKGLWFCTLSFSFRIQCSYSIFCCSNDAVISLLGFRW